MKMEASTPGSEAEHIRDLVLARTLRRLALSVEQSRAVTVVVSGPSGARKSTLLKLLAREFKPSRGGILFGDVPLKEIAEEDLRDALAFVSQDEHLFDVSVAENLRLAKPEATDEELMEILEAACLTGLIGGLTDGLATRIGEHGHELSGGQRRRLCVARALLRRPEVLLLDEPTEGVDRGTAAEMLGHLRRFLLASTLVVAAHDPTLVTEAFVGTFRVTFEAGALVPALRG
jgi:ABC-type transport system involved in cytochrome bd biosynthesis fused ATPase/permease subunit